jgi:hypothetical protein
MNPRWLFCALLPLAACNNRPAGTGDDRPTAVAPSEKPSSVAPPAATPDAGSADRIGDGEDLPTEEDYEEQAEREISAQSLESQLDQLEKEIGD